MLWVWMESGSLRTSLSSQENLSKYTLPLRRFSLIYDMLISIELIALLEISRGEGVLA